MKKLILTLAILAAGASLLRADDVAVVTFEYGGKKHQAVFEFYEGDAPQTVANFEKLARKGFYNGLTVHRAFPHTLIQMGDPLTAKKDRSKVGTGGPGYTIPPEIRRKHILGAIAAARLPDKINPTRLSNGSQFYICLKPMPSYDGQYTVFGHVASGMDTLDEISMKSVDSNDNPIDRIVIKSIKILPREKVPGLPAAVIPPPIKPAPVKPSHSKPVAVPPPVKPALTKSAHAKPAAATPAPATPAPAKTKPWWNILPSSKPAPATPAPVTPAPAKRSAGKPAPATPAPSKPTAATSALKKHGHAKPAAATPPPATPAPAKTKPWWNILPSSKPAPATPAPAKPSAAKPAPATPAPSKPAPAKPAAATPAPKKHAPKKPAPTPTPTPTPAPAAAKPWWKIF